MHFSTFFLSLDDDPLTKNTVESKVYRRLEIDREGELEFLQLSRHRPRHGFRQESRKYVLKQIHVLNKPSKNCPEILARTRKSISDDNAILLKDETWLYSIYNAKTESNNTRVQAKLEIIRFWLNASKCTFRSEKFWILFHIDSL